MSASTPAPRPVPLVLLAVFGAAVAHPVCDLVFTCGCVVFSTAHCNIHGSGPHCPWCTAPWRFALAFAFAFGASALVARRAARSSRAGWLHAAIVFVLGLMAAGAVTAWATGYPTLFGIPILHG